MIEVVSGGLYTSIQDLGRFGYRRLGVPLSGAMDSYSARLANRLVGNSINDAVLEITHIGPVLNFTRKTEIAITGAGFCPTLNNVEVPLNSRVYIPEGSTLKFGLPGYGLRAYLSVHGGFNNEKKLNSYSQYPGITTKETIEKGDTLLIQEYNAQPSKLTASVKVPKEHFTTENIHVYQGPEFHLFSEVIQKKLLKAPLVIGAESNRMAYMIDGMSNFSANEIITAPVQPGTVQLMPSGQCVVLMRDAHTSGGYARILQLSENAINVLAQKRAGEKIKFRFIDSEKQ
jgi:biotin-dependent carboxylase-like uncharacterized protein